MVEARPSARTERRRWTPRVSLTARILAVNIIALGLMAGSLFYLDSYRKQLLAERFSLARAEAQITADALRDAAPFERARMIGRIGTRRHLRLQLFSADGTLLADSFSLAPPSFAFIDPATEPWYQQAARLLDRGMDLLLGAPSIPAYRDPQASNAPDWPEISAAAQSGHTVTAQRLAPDRTPVITAAARVGPSGEVLLTTRNSTDVTQSVRDARGTLAIVVGVALAVSVLLSLFLARTIVRPLRTLVRAAVRVRLGRDREVVVPRLPDRRDEIGLLARAISDMTAALRQRIDAVESFAADVAHELKNPLTSLRSALEALDRVEDPVLRRQLAEIAAHDVRRIDRLVTEIADASRIDAELSRTAFEPVDMLKLANALVAEREQRGANGGCPIRIIRAEDAAMNVGGDALRLERVLHNLLDNAVSFSPARAAIEVELRRTPDRVMIAISDHGPGIATDAREKVFARFHSLRPAGEDFASHSGLGLAIARTIVEAHYGMLTASDRRDGQPGACMMIDLPAWEPA
ncbi:MAG: stimulus-sensing domain-containing protein [Novosphingobium sp.]